MDIKKILLITLIAVAFVVSVSVVSAGLFDGLFGGEEVQDNVIEIDNITFNTTNATNFKLVNESQGWKGFVNDNGTGRYTIYVIDEDEVEDSASWKLSIENRKDNVPNQEVNGIIVYTASAEIGEHVGEPRYMAHIFNSNINTDVILYSPDPNETAKMASTLKFK